VAATWITYFAALCLNFCDFSRYATNTKTLRKGNLWGLPVNLLAFCLVAGVTTTAAFAVYGEVLLHPEAISACGAHLRGGNARHQCRRGEVPMID
jgi:NCS1 family nucleobase:cation symporter-1